MTPYTTTVRRPFGRYIRVEASPGHTDISAHAQRAAALAATEVVDEGETAFSTQEGTAARSLDRCRLRELGGVVVASVDRLSPSAEDGRPWRRRRP